MRLTSIHLISPRYRNQNEPAWSLSENVVPPDRRFVNRTPGEKVTAGERTNFFEVVNETIPGGWRLALNTVQAARVKEDQRLPGLQIGILELRFADGSSRIIPLFETSTSSFPDPHLLSKDKAQGNLVNIEKSDVQKLLAGLWPSATSGPEWQARLETRVSPTGEWKDLQVGPQSELIKWSDVELFRETPKEPRKLDLNDVFPLATIVPRGDVSFPGMSKEDQKHPCAPPEQPAADSKTAREVDDKAPETILFPRLRSLHVVLEAKWTEPPARAERLLVETIIQIEVPKTGLDEGKPRPVRFFGLDAYQKWLVAEIESLKNKLSAQPRNEPAILDRVNELKRAISKLNSANEKIENEKWWCELWIAKHDSSMSKKTLGTEGGSAFEQSSGGEGGKSSAITPAMRILADFYDDYLKLQRLVRIRQWLEERQALRLKIEVDSAFDVVPGRPELGSCRRRLISTWSARKAGAAP